MVPTTVSAARLLLNAGVVEVRPNDERCPMTAKYVPVSQSQSMYAGATQKAVAPLQWAVDSAQRHERSRLGGRRNSP